MCLSLSAFEWKIFAHPPQTYSSPGVSFGSLLQIPHLSWKSLGVWYSALRPTSFSMCVQVLWRAAWGVASRQSQCVASVGWWSVSWAWAWMTCAASVILRPVGKGFHCCRARSPACTLSTRVRTSAFVMCVLARAVLRYRWMLLRVEAFVAVATASLAALTGSMSMFIGLLVVSAAAVVSDVRGRESALVHVNCLSNASMESSTVVHSDRSKPHFVS